VYFLHEECKTNRDVQVISVHRFPLCLYHFGDLHQKFWGGCNFCPLVAAV